MIEMFKLNKGTPFPFPFYFNYSFMFYPSVVVFSVKCDREKCELYLCCNKKPRHKRDER